jgi:hypothetical protein
MRRPRKRRIRRAGLTHTLAWLMAPILPGMPACHAPPASVDEASVCSLEGPALKRRLSEFDALVTKAGLGARRHDDGLSIRFAGKAGVRAELERWIVVESECCPSMSWTLSPSTDGGEFLLTLHGSTDARDYLMLNVPSIGRLPRT